MKKDKAEVIFKITKVSIKCERAHQHEIYCWIYNVPNFFFFSLKPSSIKALSCLEDFVFICKQEDELTAIMKSGCFLLLVVI